MIRLVLSISVLICLLLGCGSTKPLAISPQAASDFAASTTLSVALTANGQTGAYSRSAGEPIVVAWSSNAAVSCSFSADNDPVFAASSSGLSGLYTVPTNISGTVIYSVTCVSSSGNSLDASVEVVLNPSLSITANGMQGSVPKGVSDVTIAWSSVGATNCTVSPLGLSGTFGSSVVPNASITSNTIYTLNCMIGTVPIAASVTVTLTGTPSPISILANNTVGLYVKQSAADLVTISWTSSAGVTGCVVSPIGQTGNSGSVLIASSGPTVSTDYVLSCTSGGLPVVAKVSVIVAYPIIQQFSSNSSAPVYWDQVTITWKTSNTATCTLSSNITGDKTYTATSGSITSPNLIFNTTYTLSCTSFTGATAAPTLNFVIACPSPVAVAGLGIQNQWKPVKDCGAGNPTSNYLDGNGKPQTFDCTKGTADGFGNTWDGGGGNPKSGQVVLTGLKQGFKVIASNIAAGGITGYAGHTSAFSCSNATTDITAAPNYMPLLQFTHTVVAGTVSTLVVNVVNIPTMRNTNALLVGDLAAGVLVPAGATDLIGSFTDSDYDSNSGSCGFTLTQKPLCAP